MATNNSINLNTATPLAASKGGTGLASPTAGSLLVSNGASAMTLLGTVTSNQLLLPNQSCGRVYLSATVNNVTGDGTVYTVAFNAVDYDQNLDFNTTTHTLTYPVTGKYAVGYTISNSNIGSANYGGARIMSSGNTYGLIQGLLGGLYSASQQPNFSTSTEIKATAGDTATITFNLSGGSGTKTIGVYSAGAYDTFFWWRLLP